MGEASGGYDAYGRAAPVSAPRAALVSYDRNWDRTGSLILCGQAEVSLVPSGAP